ncbi:hypothetical protein BOX15_Mlig007936g1 [Macrostomum lignano]|uniref:Cytosolic carboxypeptidase-like protein 5 n=1 Tax=Macrostomum lignano TaxID=282301 RepID=A0A267DDE6_9PLAT|nr:hypothetical protein BOX15_Mlig007936g1 [Macrostomum lignano]
MVITGSEIKAGSLTFLSNFDSGNLARVAKLSSRDDSDEQQGSSASSAAAPPPPPAPTSQAEANRPDYEYQVWTRKDAEGFQFENENRTWFHFGVRGYQPNKLIKLTVMNLNRQQRLFQQGHQPVFRVGFPDGSFAKWQRVRDRCSCETVDGQFYLTFTHRFGANAKGCTTYFAFCYPWSYTESQEQLSALDYRFRHCAAMRPGKAGPDEIYYHRELLCHSLDRQRVDLLTITDCHGMTDQEEDRFDERLFLERSNPRPRAFPGKRVFLVSSRVHPGETPASFVFNGFLEFILREADARARQLRRLFVFKLIPMLNPDGVTRGHYRTDSRGVNLNRFYLDPDPQLYPTIYAVKSVLVYHHRANRKQAAPARTSAASAASVPVPDRTAAENSCAKSASAESAPELVSGDTEDAERNIRSRNRVMSLVFDETKGENVLLREGSPQMAAADSPIRKSPLPIKKQSDFRPGNEGSDSDGDDPVPGGPGSFDPGNPTCPHLCDPRLLEVPPSDSGIAYYIDLHGHCSKRGCFVYGNNVEPDSAMMENLLYPRLIAANSAYFEYSACNFTVRNMYLRDKRDGLSKAGAGRVAIWKHLGLVHSYTLECNYNSGRCVNHLPMHQDPRLTPPPPPGPPPKYAPAHYQEVGRAMAVAALDHVQSNPVSRLSKSSLAALRDWTRRYLASLRGGPRAVKTFLASSAGSIGPSLRQQQQQHFRSRSQQQQQQQQQTTPSTSSSATSSTTAAGAVRRAPLRRAAPPPPTNQQQRRSTTNKATAAAAAAAAPPPPSQAAQPQQQPTPAQTQQQQQQPVLPGSLEQQQQPSLFSPRQQALLSSVPPLRNRPSVGVGSSASVLLVTAADLEESKVAQLRSCLQAESVPVRRSASIGCLKPNGRGGGGAAGSSSSTSLSGPIAAVSRFQLRRKASVPLARPPNRPD